MSDIKYTPCCNLMYIGDNHNPVQNGRCRNCDTIIDPLILSPMISPYDDKSILKAENFTCGKCEANFDCKYAWDIYNMDGDCLAEK